MIDNNKIVDILRTVMDPVTGQDIVSMKMVEGLSIKGDVVNFSIKVPNLDANIKSQLNFSCIGAINAVYPKADVNIHIVPQQGATPGKTNTLNQIKNVIAVASGKGGVGKSTVSVNMALGLAQQGYKVGLIDADLYGPSIPTMLGLQGQRPKVKLLYGQNKLEPLEAHGIHTISIGFIIEPEQAVVLRGPRLGGIIKQFINDCLWPELDFLVIDLPPGTGDIQLTLVQTIPVTGVLMVTTPQEVAVIDAVKAMNMFQLDNVKVPIVGVVENMAWFTPAELPDNKYMIFGEGGGKKLAELAKTELVGQIPLIQAVREGGDQGNPIIAQMDHPARKYFVTAAENLVKQVDKRNKEKEATTVVKMVN